MRIAKGEAVTPPSSRWEFFENWVERSSVLSAKVVAIGSLESIPLSVGDAVYFFCSC